MTVADTYFWFAAGFGNMLSLDKVHLSPFDIPMFGSLIALVVQGYYCFRIYTLNRKALPIAVLIAMVKLFPFVNRYRLSLIIVYCRLASLKPSVEFMVLFKGIALVPSQRFNYMPSRYTYVMNVLLSNLLSLQV